METTQGPIHKTIEHWPHFLRFHVGDAKHKHHLSLLASMKGFKEKAIEPSEAQKFGSLLEGKATGATIWASLSLVHQGADIQAIPSTFGLPVDLDIVQVIAKMVPLVGNSGKGAGHHWHAADCSVIVRYLIFQTCQIFVFKHHLIMMVNNLIWLLTIIIVIICHFAIIDVMGFLFHRGWTMVNPFHLGLS